MTDTKMRTHISLKIIELVSCYTSIPGMILGTKGKEGKPSSFHYARSFSTGTVPMTCEREGP